VSSGYVGMHISRTSLILIRDAVSYHIILESRMSMDPQHHLSLYRVLPLIFSLQTLDVGLWNALLWYCGHS
jgi:hypothetical protein